MHIIKVNKNEFLDELQNIQSLPRNRWLAIQSSSFGEKHVITQKTSWLGRVFQHIFGKDQNKQFGTVARYLALYLEAHKHFMLDQENNQQTVKQIKGALIDIQGRFGRSTEVSTKIKEIMTNLGAQQQTDAEDALSAVRTQNWKLTEEKRVLQEKADKVKRLETELAQVVSRLDEANRQLTMTKQDHLPQLQQLQVDRDFAKRQTEAYQRIAEVAEARIRELEDQGRKLRSELEEAQHCSRKLRETIDKLNGEAVQNRDESNRKQIAYRGQLNEQAATIAQLQARVAQLEKPAPQPSPPPPTPSAPPAIGNKDNGSPPSGAAPSAPPATGKDNGGDKSPPPAVLTIPVSAGADRNAEEVERERRRRLEQEEADLRRRREIERQNQLQAHWQMLERQRQIEEQQKLEAQRNVRANVLYC